MTTHHHVHDRKWHAVVRLVLFSSLLVAGPLAGHAVSQVTFPTPPPAGSFVLDEAKLITAAHRQEIDRIATALNRDRGYPVTVVTIRSLGSQRAAGYAIERYASEMLKAWNLDADQRGYGLLLLVAADDRLARIELGSAWGGAHDGRVREVMDRLILPAFRRGDLSQGIVDGVHGFDAMGRGLALPTTPQPWWLIPTIAAGALVLVGAIISFGRSGRRSLAWGAAAFVGGILLSQVIAWARGGGDSGDAGGETSEDSGVTGKW